MALSDFTLDTDPKSTLRLFEQIDVLTMSPKRRRLFLREISKETRKDLRQNIKRQKTVTGEAMTPRASKKRKRMLSKMAQKMITRIPNDHQANITWKNPGKAKGAFRHHAGIPEKYTAAKAAKINGVPDYKKPATPAQAKALNKEGFKRRVARQRGKGGAIMKRVPQKWIRDNMTLGQAGLVLRLMRTGIRQGKQSWTIKVPERPVLGATPKDAGKYSTAMARTALQQIKKV